MANSNFKSEYGLLVTGDSTLLGNVVVQNTSSISANNIFPVSNSGTLGSATLQWNLSGNTGTFTNTLAVAGNVSFANTTSDRFVVTANSTVIRVGVNATPTSVSALLTVGGTVNVAGNTAIANVVTISGNTTIGANALVVSAAVGSERVGINNNAANTLYRLAVNGNTIINDGNFIISNGYVQTNQLKINDSGGLQLGQNVALTFAGLIVGDILPAYASGTLNTTTQIGNNVVVVTNNGNTNALAVNYVIVEAGVFAANTRVEAVINSTAFAVTNPAQSATTNNVVEYFSNYKDGALATYALGSLIDTNKRWEVFAKSIVTTTDISLGGTFTASNSSTTHTVAGNLAVDINTLFVDAAANRVGINEAAPGQTFVVVGTANVTANSWLSNTLVLTSNTTLSQANVSGRLVVSGNVVVNTSALVVTSNTLTTRVGVATAAPDATFAVSGTANVSGNVAFGQELTIVGNTRIGNTTSFVLAKPNGALRVTKEIEIGNTGICSNSSLMAVASSNTIIDAFPYEEYDAAKYIISYHSTSNSQVFGATELLVVHNNSTVITTEYGTVFSANVEFSLDASIPAGSANCNIYASANQGNLAVTMTRISMI